MSSGNGFGHLAFLVVSVLSLAACVPFWQAPPEKTFEPTIVGVVADVARIDRDIEVALTDGTELRVDWLVASEDSVLEVEPRPGDLLLYVDDGESNPWMRLARGDESCWVFTDGSAWDAGDHWIFKSGLLLWTASGYERPYPDDDGGWSSDTSSFCLNGEGQITDGPWGPNF